MMRTIPFAVLLTALVSCNSVSPVAEHASATHEFALSLGVVESAIPVSTAPRFRLTLTNVSDHACRILDAEKRGDLRHTYYHLVVVKDGKEVDVPRAISDPGPVSEADWIVIPPGATKTFILADFPERFEMLPPGLYQAYVDFWRDPFQSHTSAYLSPLVRFTVTK
jgi:hypothetical protein